MPSLLELFRCVYVFLECPDLIFHSGQVSHVSKPLWHIISMYVYNCTLYCIHLWKSDMKHTNTSISPKVFKNGLLGTWKATQTYSFQYCKCTFASGISIICIITSFYICWMLHLFVQYTNRSNCPYILFRQLYGQCNDTIARCLYSSIWHVLEIYSFHSISWLFHL